MPGTLTYPIYAGVVASTPRRRAYTWNAQHTSASRVAEVSAQLGRVSLSDPVVRDINGSRDYDLLCIILVCDVLNFNVIIIQDSNFYHDSRYQLTDMILGILRY